MIGRTFGWLTVVELAPSRRRHRCYACRCVCGATCLRLGTDLRKGKTRSCGCRAGRGETYRAARAALRDPMLLELNGMISRRDARELIYGVLIQLEWRLQAVP
jgi:hypothetical protein